MRRSKAPSSLNKAKRICNGINLDPDKERNNSDPEDDQYNWGSRNCNGEISHSRYENKRYFNILWRDISNKKHKTWKGDGVLEVNTFKMKAILKDETGKYLGCTTKFTQNDIAPDFQMVIGGKEIEIQNEIKSEDEIHELYKARAQNRNWGQEEWLSPKDLAEEEKKPKGGFNFKPVLVLKPPVVHSNEKNFENLSSSKLADNSKNPIKVEAKTTFMLNNVPYKEFLCFVRPSELQQFLFEKTMEYYTSVQSCLSLEKIQSLDFSHVLQNICSHPSFINHKSTTNELIRHLLPTLPDWMEMGPCDSGKLEFVQHFLTSLSKHSTQNCIILAKNPNTLNMLQGLCDFINIKCLRLTKDLPKDTQSQIIMDFCALDIELSQILIINNIETLNNFNFPINCKKLIVFEESSKILKMENTLCKFKDMTIYYLITAFSIEELLLLDTYKTNDKENLFALLDELNSVSNTSNECCYLHTKINCNCFESNSNGSDKYHEFTKNWKHFKDPFDVQLLQISSLTNSLENIVTIFCKNL